MNRTAHISDQTMSYVCVIASTFLFAAFESQVNNLTNAFSIDIYLAVRMFGTATIFALLYIFLRSAGRVEDSGLNLNPFQIDMIIWRRAFFTVAFLTGETIAFTTAKSQVAVYAFLFLNPLWQPVASRAIRRAWPPFRHQLKPLLALASGAFIFASFRGANFFDLHEWTHVYIPALIAGIAFSFSNELGKKIDDDCSWAGYKFMNGTCLKNVSALRVTFFTTYAASLLLIPVIPLVRALLDFMDLPVGSVANLHQSPIALFSLVGSCFIFAIATWWLASAFSLSKETAPIAAIDCTTLPLGAIFDIRNGHIDVDQPRFPAIAFAITIIFTGAISSIYSARLAKRKSV